MYIFSTLVADLKANHDTMILIKCKMIFQKYRLNEHGILIAQSLFDSVSVFGTFHEFVRVSSAM